MGPRGPVLKAPVQARGPRLETRVLPDGGRFNESLRAPRGLVLAPLCREVGGSPGAHLH